MPATAVWALPYPNETDPADVPVDIKKLADRSEVLFTQQNAKPPGIQASECAVWDGTQFVRSSLTRVGPASLGSGTRDGTKFLRDDGTWQVVVTTPGAGTITGAMIADGTVGIADLAFDPATQAELNAAMADAKLQVFQSVIGGVSAGNNQPVSGAGPALIGLPAGTYIFIAGCETAVGISGSLSFSPAYFNCAIGNGTCSRAVATGFGGGNVTSSYSATGGGAGGSFSAAWLLGIRYAN
jgi:hypothetical protein